MNNKAHLLNQITNLAKQYMTARNVGRFRQELRDIPEIMQGSRVPIPENKEVARAMALTGMAWLETNAPGELLQPHILRKQAEAVDRLKDFKYVAFGTNGMAIDILDIANEAQRLRDQAKEHEQ